MMGIIEKIYGNIGQGFIDFFTSERLKLLVLNKEILPWASYKGKGKRFIYKRINNISIFLHSVPSEKDDKHRGGTFLSHFIILENIEILNPAAYISSKSFITNKEEALVRQKERKEITLFQQVFYNKQNEFYDAQNNEVFKIIKNIIYHIPHEKKVIFYIDNIAKADKLLFDVFSLLPRNITINLSFSINADKLNKQTICDINILDVSASSISNNIKDSIVDITELKNDINSNYTDFLLESNFEEIQKFLFFLEKRNYSLETLELASKAYLIDIGKYLVKTEEDILDNIIGIFDETKLNNFLLKYLNKNIKISINTLKKIDDIISEKYGKLTLTIYYKFIVKYSQEDYKFFLEKYNHQKEIFIYLLCSYNLDEKVFIQQLKNYNDLNILEFLIKHDFYKEIFYIQKNKLLLLEKSWNLSPIKLKMEKDIFIEYFSCLSKSKVSKDEINSFFSKLWENSSKKLELSIFIHQNFQKELNKENLNKLYTSINKIISFTDMDNIKIRNFIKDNNFTQFKGLEKIKLVQIGYFLNNSHISEDNLDKIIQILN